jgi:hypothetical protein
MRKVRFRESRTSSPGAFRPDLNEQDGRKKISRIHAQRTAAFHDLFLESRHSAYGQIASILAVVPSAQSNVRRSPAIRRRAGGDKSWPEVENDDGHMREP